VRRLAAAIAAAGHEVGVHGWAHRYATLRGPRALHADLARGLDEVASANGTIPGCTARRLQGAQRGRAAGRPAARPPAGAVDVLGPGVGPRRHAGLGLPDPAAGPGRWGTVLHDSDWVAPPGAAAAALGALPRLLDECARRELTVEPLAEHATGAVR
jgi:peptidoglycan-N-acetylglucosamine deacetylase